MKIATFNANSIRSRVEPICRWLAEHKPDVLAVQETRVQDAQFPVEAFAQTGYHVQFTGQKGFNGVALFSRIEPQNVVKHLPGDVRDEARFLQADVGGVTVVNTYVPQGRQMGTEIFLYKLWWYGWLRDYFSATIRPASKLIWLGDFNVVWQAMDVHDPVGLWGTVCFCQEVQEAFEAVLATGLTDLFRLHHPDEPGQYTFWDYRVPNGFKRNLGWRLDYITATAALAKKCTRCEIDRASRAEGKSSDHTFLWAEFDI
jgi:exodeoxyribonuclease III